MNKTLTEIGQFLTDVVTAAGLLSHGRTDKKLATRIAEQADELRKHIHLLATQQLEPRDEVTDARTTPSHWNPIYNTDPVQRACSELPEGWGINACMERDAGWVEVYGPNGEEPDFESDAGQFDWRIHEAIDFAIEAARAGGA